MIDRGGKTFYQLTGSKKAEFITLLHPPFLLMCLSFVVIGFSIQKPVNIQALMLISIAYLLGLGIAAHALDQLPGMGSSYTKYLSPKELLTMAIVSLIITSGIGIWFIVTYNAWLFCILVPLQTFFAFSYPIATLFKGVFHNDASFAFSFGALPVVIGYYANNLYLSWLVIPFASVCFLIALIEITLSRYVRNLRAESSDEKYLQKPEAALKTLCVLSYLLAFALFAA